MRRASHTGSGSLALALLVATVSSLAGGGAGTADAAFPGQNGRLVYFYEREIWTANADGSDAMQLTASPGLDRSPSWSPDGTRIAFASERSGLSKIFVMNADGSDQRQVSFGGGRDRTNAWTQDGRQIVFDREFLELHVVNTDGSGERRLTNGLLPAASPYGDRVAFSGGAGGRNLALINLDGTNRRDLTEAVHADFRPDWSPGGTDLVFARGVEGDRDLYRVHSNGRGLLRLTTTPGRSEVGAVWSPDGTRIVFVGCPNPVGSADCGIYLMNRDGSGETQVPNVRASFAEAPLDWQPLPPFPQGQAPVPLTVTIAGRRGTGTVTSAPAGVECPQACSTEFDRGSTVRLEARPSGDAAFLGWSGACSGRSTSCSLTMDGEKRVVASFGPSTLRLTVSVRGPGRVVSSPRGIACPRRCAASFARDSRVVLRALPARGAKLTGWAGACRGSKGCRVAMNADRVVRARFRR
jgi:WD40-like Beta Propeller Repeat/Divergent InlB B-repeat domain